MDRERGNKEKKMEGAWKRKISEEMKGVELDGGVYYKCRVTRGR